ncbi:hypothetical protein [cyanobacterium endosymbiont of Epithemia turgida]|uniref:hypothetical protein n=1 Tax=cyanobacterium endosymbiont of Epithemia turgida TaxID=718217 RepID=UPI000A740F11
MFTRVKSTVRHIVPEAINGRSLLKVVYIVLDPQYQSSLSVVVEAINKNNPKLAIKISGYIVK